MPSSNYKGGGGYQNNEIWAVKECKSTISVLNWMYSVPRYCSLNKTLFDKIKIIAHICLYLNRSGNILFAK